MSDETAFPDRRLGATPTVHALLAAGAGVPHVLAPSTHATRGSVDHEKAREEQRFDGIWVLRTNTSLTAVDIAVWYKQLWMVEQVFRTAKSVLRTRPVFHKTDATICGHVFCSFLALVLQKDLQRRMDEAGVTAEWDEVLRDLQALTETRITHHGKTFVVRSRTVGVAGRIAQCLGVRLPNTVRQIDPSEEDAATFAA